jgi:hypothetical protein
MTVERRQRSMQGEGSDDWRGVSDDCGRSQ